MKSWAMKGWEPLWPVWAMSGRNNNGYGRDGKLYAAKLVLTKRTGMQYEGHIDWQAVTGSASTPRRISRRPSPLWISC